MLLANPDFDKHVQSFKQSHLHNIPSHSPAADTNVDNLTRQGYEGSTDHLQRHWITTQGHPMRNKAYFDPETTNPQADILPTNKCEIWLRQIDLMIPGSNRDSNGQSKIPLATTTHAACIYDTRGKCAGILTPDRLQILLQAYSAARQAGLHDSIQPPVQNEATEIMGLLHRYTSYLGKGNQKTKESESLRTPANIVTALTRHALVTQEKLASPLDYYAHFTAYWSPFARDKCTKYATNCHME